MGSGSVDFRSWSSSNGTEIRPLLTVYCGCDGTQSEGDVLQHYLFSSKQSIRNCIYLKWKPKKSSVNERGPTFFIDYFFSHRLIIAGPPKPGIIFFLYRTHGLPMTHMLHSAARCRPQSPVVIKRCFLQMSLK